MPDDTDDTRPAHDGDVTRVPADDGQYTDPLDEHRAELGDAQDFVRGWLDTVWTPQAEQVTSRDDQVHLSASYAHWEALVVQLRVLVGGMEPERHFGVLRIVTGGDTHGE